MTIDGVALDVVLDVTLERGMLTRVVRAVRYELGLQRSRVRKRRAAMARLRAVRDSLEPGVWIRAGEHGWRRLGTPRPAGFDAERSGQPVRDGAGHGPATPRWIARLAALGRRLSRLAVVTTPLFLLVRPRRAGEVPSGFTIADAYRPSRVLLLDVATGRVLRRLQSALPPGYVDARARFSAHLPTAPLLAHGPDWILEGHVLGEPLHSPAVDDRTLQGAIERTLAAFVSLIGAERRPGPTERDAKDLPLLEVLEEPEWLLRMTGGRRPADLLREAAIVPAHRDYVAQNLVVADGVLVCFDLDPFVSGWGPFWLDPAQLFSHSVRDPRPHVWFDEGRFDVDIARSCELGGWQGVPASQCRTLFEALAIVGLALRFTHRAAPAADLAPRVLAAQIDRLRPAMARPGGAVRTTPEGGASDARSRVGSPGGSG